MIIIIITAIHLYSWFCLAMDEHQFPLAFEKQSEGRCVRRIPNILTFILKFNLYGLYTHVLVTMPSVYFSRLTILFSPKGEWLQTGVSLKRVTLFKMYNGKVESSQKCALNDHHLPSKGTFEYLDIHFNRRPTWGIINIFKRKQLYLKF